MNPTTGPSRRTLAGLDWLNFFLADVQTGVGPFLAIYLSQYGWNEQRVGLALTVGGLAGVAAQTPAGGLVDRLHAKRALAVGGVVGVAIGAILIAFCPRFWPVLAAQALIGSASSIFIPVICAMSLGIVGLKRFDRRQGRNQAFNSAGNVATAVAMGLLGWFVSNRSIFFFVLAATVPTLWCLRLIAPDEIDHDVARNAAGGDEEGGPAHLSDLLKNRPLLLFLCCCVLFHFANAAMLPLLGELLSKGKGRSAMLFMSACVVTTQLIITLLASPAGKLAGSWGRKPLLLIGFSALVVRGTLYVLIRNPAALISVQILDGVGAGIFNVVSILVIADLTRGSGHFNLAQGAVATAVGAGASLSQAVAGSIVHHSSFRVAFGVLTVIAGAALALLVVGVPETCCPPDDRAKTDETPALVPTQQRPMTNAVMTAEEPI